MYIFSVFMNIQDLHGEYEPVKTQLKDRTNPLFLSHCTNLLLCSHIACCSRRQKACCKCPCHSNSLGCMLRSMCCANVLLSFGAFCIGLMILFTYPFYFGSDSPIDIILTPIGLVFVLEIDNWMYTNT